MVGGDTARMILLSSFLLRIVVNAQIECRKKKPQTNACVIFSFLFGIACALMASSVFDFEFARTGQPSVEK